MGDYNIDLLKNDTHSPTNDFLDLNIHHTLLPAVTRPTRVTPSTATIIDNIFSNYIDSSKLTTCILPIDISDHFPICYFAITDNQSHYSSPPVKKKRDMCRKNVDSFNDQILNQTWDDVIENEDAQLAYSNFHNIFTKLYEKCFPYKPPTTPYKARLPWLTQGLKKSIAAKNRLYNKQLKHHSTANILAYKSYRNKLNHIIRFNQRQHYQSQLELNKNNLRKSWAIINSVINRNKKARIKLSPLISTASNHRTHLK